MRITNAMRRNILHSVVTKAFEEQVNALTKKLQVACNDAFAEVYAAEIAAAQTLTPELRETMLRKKADFPLKLGHEKIRFPYHIWSDSSIEFVVRNQHGYVYGDMRYEYSYTCRYLHLTVEKHPKHFMLVKSIVDDLNKVYESVDVLKKQLNAILNSTNSSKKLLEMAPELESYFPKNDVVATTALLPLDTVNSVRAVLQGLVPKAENTAGKHEEESE